MDFVAGTSPFTLCLNHDFDAFNRTHGSCRVFAAFFAMVIRDNEGHIERALKRQGNSNDDLQKFFFDTPHYKAGRLEEYARSMRYFSDPNKAKRLARHPSNSHTPLKYNTERDPWCGNVPYFWQRKHRLSSHRCPTNNIAWEISSLDMSQSVQASGHSALSSCILICSIVSIYSFS